MAMQQMIDAVVGGRKLAALTPLERLVAATAISQRETDRMVVEFAEICVEDGSISARAINALIMRTRESAKTEQDRADLYQDVRQPAPIKPLGDVVSR